MVWFKVIWLITNIMPLSDTDTYVYSIQISDYEGEQV